MLKFDYPENEKKTVINHVNCKKESCYDCDICKKVIANVEAIDNPFLISINPNACFNVKKLK